MATTTLSTLLGLADVVQAGERRALATVDLTRFEGMSTAEMLALILLELRVLTHQIAILPQALDAEAGAYANDDPAVIRSALSTSSD